MKNSKNRFVFLTLLFVSTFSFLTLNEFILNRFLQAKAQNPELTSNKEDDLLAVKVQYPRISNIQILKKAFEVRWMASVSMEPTLHGSPNPWEADWILIDKLIYRSKLPKRGDIILFEPTESLLRDQFTEPFLKRVIALPGEKVQLKNGKLYINNKLLQEKYTFEKELTSLDVCISAPEFPPPYLAKPQIIPLNSYLVMGDRRGYSYDSRCWGVVPKKKIIGQIIKRVWSLDRKHDFHNFDPSRNKIQDNSEELFLKNVGFAVVPNKEGNDVKYLQLKLAIAIKNQDVINQGIILRSLIMYYLQTQKIDKAINYSQQFLTTAQQNQILGAQIQALGLLSIAYLTNSSYDSSINSAQKTLVLAQQSQDYDTEYASLIILAMANVGKNNCSVANNFYNQSLSVLPKLNKDYKKRVEKQVLSLFPEGKIKACLNKTPSTAITHSTPNSSAKYSHY